MKNLSAVIIFASCSLLGCATPPQADPSKVDLACAQHCSTTLATCSSGFKFFPVVVQKQCNDNYDVCIQGCPPRAEQAQALTPQEKIQQLKDLRDSGVLTQKEYEQKRKAIVNSI